MSDFTFPLASGTAPGMPAPTTCHSPGSALALPGVYASAGIVVRVENGIEVSSAHSDDGGLRNSVGELARRIRELVQASGLPQARTTELIEFAVSQVRIQEKPLPWPTAVAESPSNAEQSDLADLEHLLQSVKLGGSRNVFKVRLQEWLKRFAGQTVAFDEQGACVVACVNQVRRLLGLGLCLRDGTRVNIICIGSKRSDGSTRYKGPRFRAKAARSTGQVLFNSFSFPDLDVVDDLPG